MKESRKLKEEQLIARGAPQQLGSGSSTADLQRKVQAQAEELKRLQVRTSPHTDLKKGEGGDRGGGLGS
eukprot:6561695-Pyramimonas_sp.AAC.2